MLLHLWIIANLVHAMCYTATAFMNYFGFGIEFFTQMLVDAFYIFVVKSLCCPIICMIIWAMKMDVVSCLYVAIKYIDSIFLFGIFLHPTLITVHSFVCDI